MTRLKEIGAWLAKNGESIYGTRGGPVTPRPWGVTTQESGISRVLPMRSEDWPEERQAA